MGADRFPRRGKHSDAGVGVLVLASCLPLLLAGCHRKPFSSPTALRDTNAYAKALTASVPGLPNPRAFDDISISYETNLLTITDSRSTSGTEGDGFSHRIESLKPGEPMKGDNAIFEFVAMGVAFPTNRAGADSRSQSVPVAFYSLEGRRLSADDLKKIGLEKWQMTDSMSSYDQWPKLRFLLGSKQCPPGYYTMVGLFDARTRHQLTSGSSYSQVSFNQFGRLEVDCHAWHATPMELVLDVQLDGKVVVETNRVDDMVVSVPGGQVKVVGLWDGKESSYSSQGHGNGTPAIIKMVLSHPSSESNSVILFTCDPPGLAVHVECLDAKGKMIEQNGGYGGGGMRSMGLRALAADVRQVRFTTYTNHHQIIVPLPAIAGLPPENQQVANLFDVRIPWVQFNAEYEYERCIRESVQMEFHSFPMGDVFPKTRFPWSFTNTTPAQLLETYQSCLTNGFTSVVDQQKQEIRFEKGRLMKAVDWIRQSLGL